MIQTDPRPKYVKRSHKILEAIAGLSALSCVAGIIDSVHFHYVNLTSSYFMPLATIAIASTLLTACTSREYWNCNELINKLNERYKK